MSKYLLNLACFVLLFSSIFLMSNPILSVNIRDIVINEIAWMGTEASTSDEWIELYNNTSSDVDLNGWMLVFTDNDPIVSLSDTIPANGYLLLERTDDNTVSDISADQIYIGNLGNTGESLQLKDSSGQIIDEVNCVQGWFAGTNSPKITMERIHSDSVGSDSLNWASNDGIVQNGIDANGDPIHGTPRAQNSVYQLSTSVTELSLIPEKTDLLNNFPNPFNPVTTIHYQVYGQDVNRYISLHIYDLLGRDVITLTNKVHQPGYYSVEWDGCDDTGRETPSGIYLYQLKSDGEVIATKRMLKVK
ncbi:lamin tail domain-containing protein [bacterium]|nr:lamin tail domain-containing protein [bacterium]